MGRVKSPKLKTVKTTSDVKTKRIDDADNGRNETSDKSAMSTAQTERLAAIININHIAENGFSKDIWLSLSLEDKMSLPAFISSNFRYSNGTKADKSRNNEAKRIVHNQIMKYEKYAMRKFFSANKKKIKSMQKNDSTLSGQRAQSLVWDLLGDSEKDAWYNSHASPSQNDKDDDEDFVQQSQPAPAAVVTVTKKLEGKQKAAESSSPKAEGGRGDKKSSNVSCGGEEKKKKRVFGA